jgi:hypothetical protein
MEGIPPKKRKGSSITLEMDNYIRQVSMDIRPCLLWHSPFPESLGNLLAIRVIQNIQQRRQPHYL